MPVRHRWPLAVSWAGAVTGFPYASLLPPWLFVCTEVQGRAAVSGPAVIREGLERRQVRGGPVTGTALTASRRADRTALRTHAGVHQGQSAVQHPGGQFEEVGWGQGGGSLRL